MSIKEIFNDLRVVELAGVLAGPSAGYFFAELGAKVTKIEPLAGDITRSWKLPGEDPSAEDSAYFWSVNGGKQIVKLDLSTASGREQLHELVRTADIIITSFKEGDDVKLSADYESLRGINHGLIYASITGFGPGSPRTAYDLILQAESGFMMMNGPDEKHPLKMPVALIDIIAGHQLKEAILIALLKRARTGHGSRITVSLFASALASLANQATNWLVAHHLPVASGSLHPNIAPYGEIFTTRDGHLITFAIGSDRQFSALCDILGVPDIAQDASFAGNRLRVINRTMLYEKLAARIAETVFEDLFRSCMDRNVPLGKLRNMKEVFELPEAREMLVRFNANGRQVTAVSSIAFEITDDGEAG
jgi:crotonobetainyl-CoA:carnitine CoA-transferase CaiB-like acyl-CoA transferase